MRYFDDYFRSDEEKIKILKLFPKDFQKGYQLFRKGKLKPLFTGDEGGWYLLDP